MAIKLDKLTKPVVSFFNEYKQPIVGAIAWALASSVTKKGDVIMNPYSAPGFSISLNNQAEKKKDNVVNVRNSTERAIVSLANAGLSTSSSFSKSEAAANIFKMLSGDPNVDDAEKRLAIDMLEKLSKSTSSTFTKQEISNLIMKAAKLAVAKKDEVESES